jgi:hypothetical protein
MAGYAHREFWEGETWRSALEPALQSCHSERELELESVWCQLAPTYVKDMVARCKFSAMLHAHCESPIEKIFGAAILALYPGIELCADGRPHDRPVLVPQYQWRGFRIDWALCAPGRKLPVVFIECDGAAFHTTATQIARDRRKDAEAIDAGIQMLRFTGRDIHRHCDQCAQIAVEYLKRWGVL